jgi:hypothetical protein
LSDNRSARRSSRNALSLGIIVAGVILLAAVPLLLVVLSFSGTRTIDLPGTAVIVSATIGMALVVVGSAMRD